MNTVDRRNFLGLAALTLTATDLLGAATPARAASDRGFDSLKQIEAGELSIGYAELGATDAPAVILLHGWPYDIHAFADVAPLLAAQGYRVIIPHLRGYGTTRFLSSAAMRNGQQAVLA